MGRVCVWMCVEVEVDVIYLDAKVIGKDAANIYIYGYTYIRMHTGTHIHIHTARKSRT